MSSLRSCMAVTTAVFSWHEEPRQLPHVCTWHGWSLFPDCTRGALGLEVQMKASEDPDLAEACTAANLKMLALPSCVSPESLPLQAAPGRASAKRKMIKNDPDHRSALAFPQYAQTWISDKLPVSAARASCRIESDCFFCLFVLRLLRILKLRRRTGLQNREQADQAY